MQWYMYEAYCTHSMATVSQSSSAYSTTGFLRPEPQREADDARGLAQERPGGLQRARTEWLSGSLNVAIMMSINVELRTAPMIGLLQHYGLAK